MSAHDGFFAERKILVETGQCPGIRLGSSSYFVCTGVMCPICLGWRPITPPSVPEGPGRLVPDRTRPCPVHRPWCASSRETCTSCGGAGFLPKLVPDATAMNADSPLTDAKDRPLTPPIRNPALRIFVCSPFRAVSAPTKALNIQLAQLACREIALAGHEPVAPHLFYTRFLNDENSDERDLGIRCGHASLARCDALFVYDRTLDTLSEGMKRDVAEANRLGLPVVCWQLGWKIPATLEEIKAIWRGLGSAPNR